jgi:hypothetical protein
MQSKWSLINMVYLPTDNIIHDHIKQRLLFLIFFTILNETHFFIFFILQKKTFINQILSPNNQTYSR